MGKCVSCRKVMMWPGCGGRLGRGAERERRAEGGVGRVRECGDAEAVRRRCGVRVGGGARECGMEVVKGACE